MCIEGGRLVYGMGYLARMSMSPLSVLPPAEWSRIANEHPYIVRKVSPMNNNNSSNCYNNIYRINNKDRGQPISVTGPALVGF